MIISILNRTPNVQYSVEKSIQNIGRVVCVMFLFPLRWACQRERKETSGRI